MVSFRFLVPLVLLPLAAHAAPLPSEVYGRALVAGEMVRFDTTEGSFQVVLFPQEAPRLTQAFLGRVREGIFRQEGFWITGPRVVQVGAPQTDVVYDAAQEVRSAMPGARALRDPVNIPFLASRGAHGFERSALRPVPGSFMVDQRFIVDGQLLRREYFVALTPGAQRGEVVGHVVQGMETIRQLGNRDAILRVSVQ